MALAQPSTITESVVIITDRVFVNSPRHTWSCGPSLAYASLTHEKTRLQTFTEQTWRPLGD